MRRVHALWAIAIAGGGAGFAFVECDHANEGQARAHRRSSSHTRSSFASFTNGTSLAREARDGGVPDGAIEDDGDCFVARAVDPYGAPVRDAAVVVSETHTAAVVAEIRTGADGTFTFCEGDEVRVVDVWSDDGAWGRREISAEDDVIEVMATPAITGRVVDENGTPIAGAELRLSWYQPADDGIEPEQVEDDCTLEITGERVWTTDAAGRFEIQVGQLEIFTLIASAPGFTRSYVGPFVMTPGAHHERDVRMRREMPLSFRVLGGGAPIAYASIHVRSEPDTDLELGVTDPLGRFVLEELPPTAGPIEVHISTPGWSDYDATLQAGHHEIELRRGASLRVEVAVPPFLARCILWDLVMVSVSVGDALRASGALGEENNVRFESLPPGRATVVAWVFGMHTMGNIELREGGDHSITLRVEVPPNAGAIAVDSAMGSGYFELHSETNSSGTEVVSDGETCAVAPAGHYDGSLYARDTIESGPVEILAGRLVRWRPARRLPRDVEEDPEPEREPRCTPEETFILMGGSLIVAWSPPSPDRAFAGDRVIAVLGAEAGDPDSLHAALEGEPGTSAIVTLQRPDGTRRRIELARTDCE